MLVQKAKHLYAELDKKNPSCLTKDYMIFEKYDGWYGYIDIVNGMMGCIHSRADRAIPSLMAYSHLLAEALPSGVSGRLLFEITIPTTSGFSELNGILNRSKAPCQASGVVLKCHDFIRNMNELTLIRYNVTKDLVKAIDLDWVQLAPLLAIGSYRDVQAAAELIWADDGEGAIGKQIDAPYNEGKRNSTLIKVKEDVDADLWCIGTYAGKGKYTGMMGGLILRDKAGVEHRASGMTDEDRLNPSKFVHQVIECKAMKKLKEGTYRELRYKAIRHDKTVDEID